MIIFRGLRILGMQTRDKLVMYCDTKAGKDIFCAKVKKGHIISNSNVFFFFRVDDHCNGLL